MINDLFEEYLRRRKATRTRMFGSEGVMIGGNVMMFHWKNTLVFRLGPDDAGLALAIRGAKPFSNVEGGRESKSWIAVPVDSLDSNVVPVAEAAFRFVSKMPPKEVKKKAKAPATKKKAAAKKSTARVKVKSVKKKAVKAKAPAKKKAAAKSKSKKK